MCFIMGIPMFHGEQFDTQTKSPMLYKPQKAQESGKIFPERQSSLYCRTAEQTCGKARETILLSA